MASSLANTHAFSSLMSRFRSGQPSTRSAARPLPIQGINHGGVCRYQGKVKGQPSMQSAVNLLPLQCLRDTTLLPTRFTRRPMQHTHSIEPRLLSTHNAGPAKRAPS